MANTRTFQISSKLFWGFKIDIDLDEVSSNKEIIDRVISTLRYILISNNLILLSEMLDGKNENEKMIFHIHEKTFENILLEDPKNEIYICDHSH
jgi:hypothetical protein